MSDDIEQGQPAMWAEGEWPATAPKPPASEPAPQPPARFQAVNRQQMVWRAVDVEQLLEPDHLARAIWEMSGRLDLTPYTVEVRAVEGAAGRPPLDPRLLIALWVYAYSEKVSSAREVERRCAYHPAYQWLTGCEVINHHTLSDFRVQHQEALDGLFAQLLAILRSEGLLTLQQVVHDGTKVKAAASGKSWHREKTLRAHLQAAAERGLDLIGGTMEKAAEAVRQGLKKRGLDPAFYPQNFRYHPETNSYGCPAGKILAYQRTRHDRVGVEHQVYKARAADCRNCAWRSACKPGQQGRLIVRSENVPAVAAYVAKMQTAAARAAYRRRAPVAEFSNLWLKAKLGLRQFCVRGLQKARCEVLWACFTYNIQQWFRLRWKERLNAVAA